MTAASAAHSSRNGRQASSGVADGEELRLAGGRADVAAALTLERVGLRQAAQEGQIVRRPDGRQGARGPGAAHAGLLVVQDRPHAVKRGLVAALGAGDEKDL